MSDTTSGLDPVLWRFLIMAGVGLLLGYMLSDLTEGEGNGSSSSRGEPAPVPAPEPSVNPKPGPRSVRVVAENVVIRERKGQRAARVPDSKKTPEPKE